MYQTFLSISFSCICIHDKRKEYQATNSNTNFCDTYIKTEVSIYTLVEHSGIAGQGSQNLKRLQTKGS